MARVVVYIKKTLEYIQVHELEEKDIQSIWIRGGFRQSKKVFYSHQYREHTSTLGSNMSTQRTSLNKMLAQWEAATRYGGQDQSNEVHVSGDMNIDCLNGRWLDASYSLVSLGRMAVDFCNVYGFSQLGQQTTRVQFNSVSGATSVSCIDHVYCNTKYRVSNLKVVSFGGSDHDAIVYSRLSKEPKPPSRTIRKRSYKNFSQQSFISDVANLDFLEVYNCLDADCAAAILTTKLVDVLNHHAPWVIYQERKNFAPWIRPETVCMMRNRDKSNGFWANNS